MCIESPPARSLKFGKKSSLNSDFCMFVGKLKIFEPIDRAAVPLMVLLILAIGFLLSRGDRSLPKVRD